MLWKSILRDIKESLGRFITIFIIIALGVGFFTGLRVTKKAMVKTADIYLENHNFYDFRLINTLGYTEEDVNIAAKFDGVEYAEGSFFISAIFDAGRFENAVFTVHTLTENLNTLELHSGRLPEREDECIADSFAFGESMLGQKVVLDEENDEDTLDKFKFREFTIVGLASSPLYINFERGQASMGDGQVDAFLYIPYDALDVDYYTEIFITLSQKEHAYSVEYNDLIDSYEKSMENLAEERADNRYETIVSDGEQEIADAEKELEDAKREYNKALRELSDAKRKLKKAKTEIDNGWSEYNNGREELEKETTEAKKKLEEARAKLTDAYKELTDGEAEYEIGLKEVQDASKEIEKGERELADAKTEVEAAQAELNDAKEKLSSARESYDSLSKLNSSTRTIASMAGMSDASQLIAAIENGLIPEEQLTALEYALQGYGMSTESLISTWRMAENGLRSVLKTYGRESMSNEFLDTYLPVLQESISSGQSEYDKGLEEYNAGLEAYMNGRTELDGAIAQVREAEAKLDTARAELDKGWAEYNKGVEDLQKGEAELQSETEKAETELADAETKLKNADAEYQSALRKYNREKAKADKELADAAVEISDGEKKIEDAKEELEDLERPTVFTMDRYMNTGYACFENDTSIVEGISTVFPLFFLLVAALVCITTMTRMVDEHRGQIGTLKALGYSQLAIMGEYLFYSGTASILGCIVGVFGGSYIFPKVLWKAYNIMYGFAPITFVLDHKVGMVSSIAFFACALGATYFACYSQLAETPAQIIRPRAPANGKRIFLEYITPLWKRMSFLYKVSARNIFRYKKRLFMMLIGVAGSTALVLTGFGINDSIKDVVNYQFEEINLYEITVTFKDPPDEETKAAFMREFSDSIENVRYLQESSVDVVFDGKSKQAYMIVPDAESLEGFFDIHSGDEQIPFPKSGEVVINNGLAEHLKISVGDKIKIQDPDLNEMRLTVSGIFDNYIYNYAILAEESYTVRMGEMPEMKTVYVCIKDGVDVNTVGAEMMGYDGVLNVTVNDTVRTRVNNMLESLNYIVVFIIACAGALAFTVIYNLTNINITERIREIATIRVLGFYYAETAEYVFRENMIMTAMGTAIGLVLGKILHAFVMSQIKIDLMCFDVRISPLSYLYAVLITFGFAVIVMFFMYFKLKKVNMAESLKSIE